MALKHQVCGFIHSKLVAYISKQESGMEAIHILSKVNWVYLLI